MNTERFSEAISEIDEALYEEAASYVPPKAEKSLWLKWGSLAACFVLLTAGIGIGLWQSGLFFSAVSNNHSEGTNVASQSSATTTTTVAEPVGQGGDSVDFSSEYWPSFSIGELFTRRVKDQAALEKWLNCFDFTDAGGTRNATECNLFEFITDFSITRESIEPDLREYEQKAGEPYMSEEELAVLFSGDRVRAYQYFANSNGVVVGMNSYPPEWLVSHSAVEYAAVGITPKALGEKLEKALEVCAFSSQRKHILDQQDLLIQIDNGSNAAALRQQVNHLLQQLFAAGGTTSATATGGLSEGAILDLSRDVPDDSCDYVRSYVLKFAIDPLFVEQIKNPAAFTKWMHTFKGVDSAGTRNDRECNLFELVTDFSLTREAVEPALRKYREMYNVSFMTDEQLKALFSGDRQIAYRCFVNPYAVLVGDEPCEPKWFAYHTAVEYAAVGITPKALGAKLQRILSVCPYAARRMFILNQQEELLKSYTGGDAATLRKQLKEMQNSPANTF